MAQNSDMEFQTLQSSATELDEGDTIELTFKIKNQGPNSATNVIITDLLPASLTYVSDDGGGEYNSGTNVWTAPSINSGATKNLKITVKAGPGSNGTTITVNPVISGLDQNDPDLTNNSLSLDLIIFPLDLEMKKKVNNSTPEVGEIIEYELELKHRNTTTLSATNIIVQDILSPNLTYISDDSGGNYNPVTGVWDITSLTPGQSVKMKILVQINSGTSGLNINNVARIIAFDQNDLDQSNDEAFVEV